jgi:exonuclease III
MTIIELIDYTVIIVYTYRSPDGNFDIFLSIMKLLIQKQTLQRKRLILCGDWNINLFQDSVKSSTLKNWTLDA